MTSLARRCCWLGSALLLAAGCVENIQLLAPRDAGAESPEAVTPAADRCARVSDTCVDPVARIFRYALCTCEDAAFNGPLETDAFDSSQPPGGPARGGASVGTNARFVVNAPVELAGSWIASGADSSVFSSGRVHITGNLKTQGDLKLSDSEVSLDRDLWVHGQLVAIDAMLRAKGVRYQSPPDTSVGDITADGGTLTRQFTIAPPCPCGDRAPIDFDALASQFAARNDNAALGVSTDRLRSDAELPCGHYVLGAGRLSETRWRVSGRVALFVDGDLELTERFEPEFAAGGALEIFVRGKLTLAPGVSVGTIEHAGALRLFVGGQSTFALTGGTTFAAHLYAPLSRVLVLSSEQVFHGSLFVARYLATAQTTIHFDHGVSAPAADSCAPPACSADADCEDPSLCSAGRCVAHVASTDDRRRRAIQTANTSASISIPASADPLALQPESELRRGPSGGAPASRSAPPLAAGGVASGSLAAASASTLLSGSTRVPASMGNIPAESPAPAWADIIPAAPPAPAPAGFGPASTGSLGSGCGGPGGGRLP